MKRAYYSVRKGRNEGRSITLAEASSLLMNVFEGFSEKGWFQFGFGYGCVDGSTYGNVGRDPSLFFFRKLRKRNLWPLAEALPHFTEDDLFDVIEVLHDLVAKPERGRYHNFSNCGWHYEEFDVEAGQVAFRKEVNEFLSDYDSGYVLTENGEILRTSPTGLEMLVESEMKSQDPDDVDRRVAVAVQKFRRRGNTAEDQLDAVRDLAAVLEFLRPQAKKVLARKDEQDLFNIANNFAIRHHNKNQAAQYDRDIWLPWMFYFYLATAHTLVALIQREPGR